MNKVLIFALPTLLCVTLLTSVGISVDATPPEGLISLQNRAQAWFKAPDKKSRRLQMRSMTRALKQPCKYCHTKGFNGYTDRHEISLRMMVISTEHGVECGECHTGKNTFSALGETSKKMFHLATKLGVECTECHVPKARFRELTEKGMLYREATEKEGPDLGVTGSTP